MSKTTRDLHLHTRVSDGSCDALALFEAAREVGLEQISITDHDALGAYRHYHPNLFGLADAMGLELISGIELDTHYQGSELHLLGYGIDIDDPALNAHLTRTQSKRREKVTRQIEAINRHFERTVIDPSEVILPERDTLMKPHLVHGLLKTGLWGDEYRDAQKWLNETIKVEVTIPKLPIQEAIALVHGAGGKAVLAHPGYLSLEHGFVLASLIAELKAAGLDGVEVEYPYHGTAKAFADPQIEREIVGELRDLAHRLELTSTRGSDAHDPKRLMDFALRTF